MQGTLKSFRQVLRLKAKINVGVAAGVNSNQVRATAGYSELPRMEGEFWCQYSILYALPIGRSMAIYTWLWQVGKSPLGLRPRGGLLWYG